MGTIFSCCARPGQSSPSEANKILSPKTQKHHSARSWKTLVVTSAKKDEEKLTVPSAPTNDLLASSSNQCTGQTGHGCRETATPPPIPRQAGVDPQCPVHQTTITATTGELMYCLDVFIRRCCYWLVDLKPGDVTSWCRSLDHLLLQGWQQQTFITPANIVIIYMLCREAIGEGVETIDDLRATFYTCLYIAYAYMGWEISYPVQPFIAEPNRSTFWKRCLSFTLHFSAALLKINNDELFFARVFQELKHEGDSEAIYYSLSGYWEETQDLYVPSMPATPEASYDDDPLGLRNLVVFDDDDGLRLASMDEVGHQEGPANRGAFAPDLGYYYFPGFGCFPDLMAN